MRATYILLVAIGAVLLLSAYQREATASRALIRQTVNLKNGTVTHYTYTSSGLLSSVCTPRASTTYTYIGHTVIKQFSDSVDHVYTTDTILLDSRGLAVEQHNASEAKYGITHTFEYDAAGYLIRSQAIDKGIAMIDDHAVISGGNRISLSQSGHEATKPNMLYYHYDMDHLNTIGDENMGMPYMGHSARHVVREMIAVSPEGDTLRSFYRYHYDDRGRIIIRAAYRRSGLTDSVGYSY